MSSKAADNWSIRWPWLVCSETIYGSDCLVNILKCSRLRPALNTHKDLFVSRTQLNEMCKQQDRFFRCLDHTVASMETDESSLPSPLKHARALIKDLCLNTSSWQTKYFDLAPCINRQYTEFCTSAEFLGTVRLADKPRNKCSLREEAVNCIAATLAMNCGMDAGKLFHHLLRMASDGGKNCYAVGSEILFLPPVQEAKADQNMEAYTEVYSSLVKRIGSIPEQDESVENSLPVVEAFAEDIDLTSGMGDTVTDFLAEFASSAPTSEETSTLFSAPYTTGQREEGVIYPKEMMDAFSERLKALNQEYAIRFHGNNSISEYSRHAGYNFVEFIYCFRSFKGGKKVHICSYALRNIVPVCLEGERIHRPIDDPIDPEDIDPVLGARLYAMFPYSYPFKPFEEMAERMLKRLRESKRASLPTTTDDSESATNSTTPDIDGIYRSIYDEHIKNLEVSLGLDSSYPYSEVSIDEVNDGESKDKISENGKYSSQSSEESLAADRLRNYVMAITTPRPRSEVERVGDFTETTTASGATLGGTNFDITRLSREHKRMYELLEEADWLLYRQAELPISRAEWVTPQVVQITVDSRENSHLLNMTCGRVNECHPNSTDIHKCQYFFEFDYEEPTKEVKIKSHRMNSRGPTKDVELNTQTHDKILSSTEEVSELLENVQPVVLFDESYDQSLDVPVTEIEAEYSSFLQSNLEETEEISEQDPEAESVQFVLLEPDALDAMPFLHSEQTFQMVTEGSVDNEHTGSEYGDLTSEDEYPTSDSSLDDGVGESLSLNFIQSLTDLENMIASGLENIQVE